MKLKQWQNIFHMIVNASSIVQHVIQINNGIMSMSMEYVNVIVKIIGSVKSIIVGILPHVFVRILSIEKVLLILQRLHVMKLHLLWVFY